MQILPSVLGRVVQSWVSAKFELRYESLKSKFSLILFAYNLMIVYSKKNRENYLRECFWQNDKAFQVKF